MTTSMWTLTLSYRRPDTATADTAGLRDQWNGRGEIDVAAAGTEVSVAIRIDGYEPLAAAQACVDEIGWGWPGWIDLRAEGNTVPHLELMAAGDVAEVLQVTRQRVHQLRNRSDFPAPLAQLRTGPVWDARDIDRYASTSWKRMNHKPNITETGRVGGQANTPPPTRPSTVTGSLR